MKTDLTIASNAIKQRIIIERIELQRQEAKVKNLEAALERIESAISKL